MTEITNLYEKKLHNTAVNKYLICSYLLEIDNYISFVEIKSLVGIAKIQESVFQASKPVGSYTSAFTEKVLYSNASRPTKFST